MRVQAVVVTFNRLAMLQRLIARLQETPGLEQILVVDNASTDGTGEWLRGFEARCARTSTTGDGSDARTSTTGDGSDARTSTTGDGAKVAFTTLDTNTGGAGGFHHGLGWAVDEGADLVWLMDDDGLPAPDCLALLLDRVERDGLDFCGPAVLAEQDPTRLCFPIRLPGGTRVVHEMAAVEAAARDGLIDDVVIPFNGVLVTRDLVARIGLPREEFFIWGDDVEYLWRAERAGARIATVVDAHFLHPATDDLGTPMMFGRTTYNHTPSDLKHYCMARNNTLNLRAYRGWIHVLLFWLKTVWFYLFTRPQPARIPLSARAAASGLRGDFTGHRRYLR